MAQRSWNLALQEEAWRSHCAATAVFAKVIQGAYKQGDLVWIYDYHLLVLPSILLRKIPRVNTGIFLHVPFPSSEIFRTLAVRREILKSLLCADHVGFHQYEYARHFITCCKRMLGLSYKIRKGGSIGIPYNGRNVSITCSHAGLDTRFLTELVDSTIVQNAVVDWRKLCPTSKGVKIISSVDKIEGLRGLTLKLLAFERFLQECPKWRGQVRLIQLGVETDCRPDDRERVSQEVTAMAAKINDQFGEGTVVFVRRSFVSMEERLALWACTDIMLNTCVRS